MPTYLDAAERLADRLISPDEAARLVREINSWEGGLTRIEYAPFWLSPPEQAVAPRPTEADIQRLILDGGFGRQEAIAVAEWSATIGGRSRESELERQAALLRDIVPNPFRDVARDRSWLTSSVRSLAESIAAGRTFGLMPVLADALQDAGCDQADILAHCRGDGPHVRGCWVVSLLLGRR